MSCPNNLAAERHNCGMTQMELARRADVAVRTIVNVENGCRCQQQTKRRLLRGLGIEWEKRWMVFPPEVRGDSFTERPRL